MNIAADITGSDVAVIEAPDLAQALGELAALGMILARDAAARAQAAETGPEAAALCMAFERLARSVRLTFALRERMARQTRIDRVDQAQVRKKQIRSVVARTLPRDLRDRERHDVLFELDERLHEEALDGGLSDGPVEAVIARLRKDLDLELPAPGGVPGTPHAILSG